MYDDTIDLAVAENENYNLAALYPVTAEIENYVANLIETQTKEYK